MPRIYLFYLLLYWAEVNQPEWKDFDVPKVFARLEECHNITHLQTRNFRTLLETMLKKLEDDKDNARQLEESSRSHKWI